MDSHPDRLRAVAVGVAEQAAEAAVVLRDGALTGVRTKSSGTDVVTRADTRVEELLRTRLGELRPGEPVLGEEGGAGGAPEPGQLSWVVDPIDGTVNYLYGLPWYAVSVAAVVDGAAVAGAVVEPVSGRVWSAAAGHGASLDGAALSVSSARRLDLSLLATGFGYQRHRRARQGELIAALLPRVRDVRRSGSAALDLCAVAAGWVDGYLEHGLSPWDWAAAALIAREAGALVSPPGGAFAAALGADALLAVTPGIVDELLETLTELGCDTV